MKPEEINIAIALHFGWSEPRAGWMKHPESRKASNVLKIAPVPKYISDLQRVHEAEITLTAAQKKEQIENAVRIVQRDNGPAASAYFATAIQRAEAFLRTIGKWQESPAA